MQPQSQAISVAYPLLGRFSVESRDVAHCYYHSIPQQLVASYTAASDLLLLAQAPLQKQINHSSRYILRLSVQRLTKTLLQFRDIASSQTSLLLCNDIFAFHVVLDAETTTRFLTVTSCFPMAAEQSSWSFCQPCSLKQDVLAKQTPCC